MQNFCNLPLRELFHAHQNTTFYLSAGSLVGKAQFINLDHSRVFSE